MAKNLVIIGAGGHAEVVLDACIEAEIEVAGFIDNQQNDSNLRGHHILGNDDMLGDSVFIKEHKFIVAIGDQQKRSVIFNKTYANGGKFFSVIHPSAIISKEVKIGEGSFVGAGAVVQTSASIGKNVIINTSSVIEHHCKLSDNVHISPGAVVTGGVTCENGAFIGAGAVVTPEKKIGKNSVIGAGAMVLSDVADGKCYVGNPAKEKRK